MVDITRQEYPQTDISFIKNSKLWCMPINGENKKLVDDQLLHKRILAWNETASKYLLLGNRRKVFLLNTEDKILQELLPGVGNFKDITVNSFIELSRTFSNGKSIFANKIEGSSWRLLEDHPDYKNAKVIIDDGNINLTPAWMNNGRRILYASSRKS